MKITFTKTDFAENGGKLFLSYLDNIFKWESNTENKSLFSNFGTPITTKIKKGLSPNNKDKVKMEKIKSFNTKIDSIRNLKLLAEQIVGKILSDSGVTLERKSLEAAKKKIQKKLISKDSARRNFDVEIEFDSETGRCNFIPEKVPELKPKLDQSMEFDVESKQEVKTKSEFEAADEKSDDSQDDDSDKTNVEMEPEKIKETKNAVVYGNPEDVPMIIKKVPEVKPKLELDQSMEVDVEPKQEIAAESDAADGNNSDDSQADDSDKIDVEMKPVELDNSSKPESRKRSDSDSKQEDFEKKLDGSQADDSRTKTDAEMKLEIMKPNIKDENVTTTDESSPYSPSKLSEDLRNEIDQKSINSDFDEQLRREVSWTRFLDGVESVPSSPSSHLRTKSSDSEDERPKTSEAVDTKNEASPTLQLTTQHESEMEGTEKFELDSAEKTTEMKTSEHLSTGPDLFLPEDASLVAYATSELPGVTVEESCSQESDRERSSNTPFLNEITEILSAPAQVNE